MRKNRAVQSADRVVVTFALAGDDPRLPASVVCELDLTDCVLGT